MACARQADLPCISSFDKAGASAQRKQRESAAPILFAWTRAWKEHLLGFHSGLHFQCLLQIQIHGIHICPSRASSRFLWTFGQESPVTRTFWFCSDIKKAIIQRKLKMLSSSSALNTSNLKISEIMENSYLPATTSCVILLLNLPIDLDCRFRFKLVVLV